jgi:hypothetical protein
MDNWYRLSVNTQRNFVRTTTERRNTADKSVNLSSKLLYLGTKELIRQIFYFPASVLGTWLLLILR